MTRLPSTYPGPLDDTASILEGLGKFVPPLLGRDHIKDRLFRQHQFTLPIDRAKVLPEILQVCLFFDPRKPPRRAEARGERERLAVGDGAVRVEL
jgi:hypothetical protein